MNRRRGVADDSSDEDTPGNVEAGNLQSQQSGSPSSNGDKPEAAVSSPQNDDDDENSSEDEDADRASDDNDSSEESDDDDNEDEIARVREGFIVDSDDDEDDDDASSTQKKRRRKRRRQAKEEAVQLDEDDLDLLGLATSGNGSRAGSAGAEGAGRFKRLKKASSSGTRKKGLDAMFDDEDNENESEAGADSDNDDLNRRAGGSRGNAREFDDFIEADEFSEDEEEALRREEEREIGQRRKRESAAAGVRPGLSAVGDLVGLDEEKLSEIYEVFGDGEMYDWALAGEEEEGGDGAHPPEDEDLQLTDVFEPSELSARMLTSEDNQIRSEDLPERYQLLRQRLQHPYDLSDDAEYFEKKQWIADALLALKSPNPELRELTRQAINQVIDCVSRDNLEVPFIWHHRQDYLVHFSSTASDATREQLLNLDDLWRIVDLDLDFHALVERRRAMHKLESQVDFSAVPKSATEDAASKFSSFSADATTGVEYQDLVDYIQFIASAQLRAARRHSRFSAFDRIRQSATMELLESLGIQIDKVAEELVAVSTANASSSSLPSRHDIIDPGHRDSALTPTELITELGDSANMEDAISYEAHALSYDPRLRRFFRQQFEREARVDIVLTDDGRRKITVNSPFADLKYSCNWTLEELRKRPALFLRMLRAESQGLLIVRAQYPHYKTTLYTDFEKLVAGIETNTDVHEWVEARKKVAKAASRIVVPLIARNILENLRADCVRTLRYEVRSAFSKRLDQAPYKPPGYVLGTIPRVLCISSGEGGNTDAVIGAVVDEDGHVSEVFKLGDSRNASFKDDLVKNVKNVRPDVVGVAGFTPAARRLHETVKSAIVDTAQLMTGPEDAEQPLAVVWVQDEVARLYRHSERAAIDFPDLVPNARYCVALARYLQNPLLEYAQLDSSQLRNLVLHPDQALLPDDEFAWATETAFVDTVCMEGVDLNQAVRSSYHAASLQYVSGLGPRKAGGIVQSVLARAKGGRVSTRTQLVTSEITSRIIFMNCASFLKIPWSPSSTDYSSEEAEYLDATRIHPEDYELARKMCADALELDEEDVEAVEERQVGGVVGQLLTDDPDGKKLDELVLEEYAEELEQLFKQKKRITLEQIRREIQDAYGELRAPLRMLTPDEVFTMLTGETRDTYSIGSVVSGTVRRVTGRQLVLSLSGGIDGVAETGSISDDRSVPLVQQFAPGQAVQAELISIDYGALYALVNTRQSAVTEALRRTEQRHGNSNKDPKHWNSDAEKRDIQMAQRRSEQRQRQLRVIKHPLFRPFGAKEAEAYLAPLQRGDLVIRPSSLGMDHLVVTWKVSDQIYQHIDVQELDKPNDYAVGRTLQIGPYKYTDLDELIIMHVQSMARKVDEMCACEKFQKGNRGDVEKWLSAYTNARPTQSVYAFCFEHRRPGYFLLCYMLGANQPIKELHVKVLPNGYGLLRNAYTDVQSLTNGFKMMVQRSRV